MAANSYAGLYGGTSVTKTVSQNIGKCRADQKMLLHYSDLSTDAKFDKSIFAPQDITGKRLCTPANCRDGEPVYRK